MSYSVLIVDDEALTVRTIGRALESEGFEVFLAMSGEEALTTIAEEKPDLALLDVVLPGINGIEVLRQAKKLSPATIIVMMSAYHVVDRAVEAMKLGAYDYLIKPFHIADMVNTIRRATEMLALRVRVHDTVQSAKGRYDFGRVVTQSPAMREILEMARRAAESDRTTILIQGESGTGKEVLAKAIHYNSPRAQAPLISLNCAALPDTLLESELFGYEQGAFTDARRRKEGLIEKASGGTLFLDEVSELPLAAQVKLLRALQEGAVEAVGGRKPVKVDVRIISATNRKLLDRVKGGQFREDLFYRLHVLPLTIPPLRMRREDIPHLLRHFLARFCAEENRPITGISGEAMALLSQLEWPGNIRQLENAVYRAVVMSDSDQLGPADFPQAAAQSAATPEARNQHGEPLIVEPAFHSTAPAMVSGNEIPIAPLPSTGTMAMLTRSGEMRPLEEMESEIIRFAISHYRGQMSEVARRLKIGRSTLYRKLDEAAADEPAAGGADDAS